MSPSSWEKIAHKFDAVFTLEKRQGPRAISYRYRFRRSGLVIEGVLPGRDSKTGRVLDLKEIAAQAEREITKKRNEFAPKPRSLVRSADLCDEIVALKKSKAPATYEQTEIFFRVHIKPYLIDHCAYAEHLNPTVWTQYKNAKRIENPDIALFNHWKFFRMLFRYAYEKGILKQPCKLEFDMQKEDFRELGQVIPDDELQRIVAAADPVWRDRIILQRLTGQRPGVIRRLAKDRVDFETGVISIRKEDSKNRRAYSFQAPRRALEILRARSEGQSAYFFPRRGILDAPMDKSLKGWHSALKRAFDPNDEGLEIPNYTPHDIRHTFLTEKFRDAKNPALVCFQCDLSLEVAMQTYIHFRAEDTRVLADEADADAARLFGWGGPDGV